MPIHDQTDIDPATDNATTTAEAAEDRVRLHITPFNESLLKVYVPPSLLPQAREISFHNHQTFPEKSFGFIDLPKMEAQKLKKKLNGSILRGKKVKIEDARPETWKSKVGGGNDETERLEVERPRKRKIELKQTQGVLPGVELPEDRKVKRGWTDPEESAKNSKKSKREGKARKKAQPSVYTKEPEMLFRAKMPQNVEAENEGQKLPGKKEKKRKARADKLIIHEFENRRTLRSQAHVPTEDPKTADEYIEGHGWVNAIGEVVEPAHKPKKTTSRVVEPSNQKSESDNQKVEEKNKKHKLEKRPEAESNQESTARISGKQQKKREKGKKIRLEDTSTAPDPENSIDNANSGTAKEQTQSWTAQAPALEALYKRRGVPDIKPELLSPSTPSKSSPTKLPPINTGFSFSFGSEGNVGEGEQEDDVPPLTPFTREDQRMRRRRSAAPTPDTAALGRKFSFSFVGQQGLGEESDQEEDEGGEVDEGERMDVDGEEDEGVKDKELSIDGVHPDRLGQVEKKESEFAKWFWEHRGETNRAWKKRKRDAMKVKRQRENRRLTKKVI
jgi:hypothetical protein